VSTEEKILAVLEKMDDRLGKLEGDVSGLRVGQATLEAGQTKLETEIASMQGEIGSLSRRYDIQKVLLEDVQRRTTAVQDGQAFVASDVRTVREDVTRIDRTTREIWGHLMRHDQEISGLKEM